VIRYHGRSRRTVNLLKTLYFDRPEWTICEVGLLPATWMKHREDLEELVLAHPRIFPGYRKGSRDFDQAGDPTYEPGRHTDCWGTVWDNVERGLAGMPVEFPLTDWSAFEEYVPPDPLTDDWFGPRRNWEDVRRDLAAAKARGGLAAGGGLPHGFMYMRLYYLRGFENLMVDIATDEPRLQELTAMVEGHNAAVIGRYLELGAEYMSFGDDLGLQDSLPMSPGAWRKYIKPSYERLLGRCRDADVPVSLHTDGHVLEIIPDLIEVGVRMLNPQLRANGLEGLRRWARGKVALRQDLDRQLFPFATPGEIEDHVGEVFEALHLPTGGLALLAEVGPDVPLENVEALCTAFERLCNPPEPED
jgi:uroporphyrinogen decarboxylase